MRVEGEPYRSLWPHEDAESLNIIDQTELPHRFVTRRVASVAEAAEAIAIMRVRGAPLIGVTAAYGLWLALREDPSDAALGAAIETLAATRPTAVNLRWALERVRRAVAAAALADRAAVARDEADRIAEADVAACRKIGEHGANVLELLQADKGGAPLNILTHCNAGWLATVDWGTALAPIYVAHDAGVPVHVWVDETRPRNQGASLTAWELREHGVPHTVIADNTGGHLMQHQKVDVCLVGSDRTTRRGDVCNKIGTYLKALAADDNGVPFYVALPSSTIDFDLDDGVREIPIEQRDPAEIHEVAGIDPAGNPVRVRVTPAGTDAANFAFDVTPARLVTGLITERGICEASTEGLEELFGDDHDV